MNPFIQFKTTTNLILRSPSRRSLLLIPLTLALVCFALLQTAQAVVPAPDGGYPNQNTAEGEDALFNLSDSPFATDNTAIGFNALFNNIGGFGNTAIGSLTLYHNIGGIFFGHSNTATGWTALQDNTTGSLNTANGAGALFKNTEGRANTATDANALLDNTTGDNNTAAGYQALRNNETGINNTAMGFDALLGNTTGINNTATGFQALHTNTTGDNNTANGIQALYSNTSGINNTASGLNALFGNSSGGENTAVGHDALVNNTTGSDNIAVGHGAGENLTTGNNNIDIGNGGVAGEANTIRIGRLGFFVEPGVLVGGHTKTFIAGISGTALGAGVAVRVKADGQLGTTPSAARFKTDIKQMEKASEAIHALKPVTFRYKEDLDPEGIPQFRLVAEDVARVNPDLVVREADGKVYSVRYDAVNAMLLNEFLKEHRTVQEQQKEIDALKAELKEQRALIQKVSDKVELSRPAPLVAENK